ncbi:MAG: putative D-glucosyl-N-acylsphingosine glucohydrolase [Puniceicoccaceae bacterium 5H]|nr:MAG: putative D-glucosyl-N-acylsphingosine glucohydrolase [Puniceicoccaceae bacterium 5H]
MRHPLAWFSTFTALCASLSAMPVTVQIHETAHGFELLRDGQPYFIKGAGGSDHLETLAEIGGNSIRTWGSDQTEALLDEAERLGLTVTAGLWMTQERQGMDYHDKTAVKAQLERLKQEVLQFKDHPALLAWGIGNELEMGDADPVVWAAVEELAAYIHEVDPHHPTMTVTAFIDEETAQEIKRRAPSIDILGVNAYAPLNIVGQTVRDSGWDGPYVVTEWGPNGTWEVGQTRWGARIEPTSTEAARQRATRHAYLQQDAQRCLGGYVFYWGMKNETTPTWFSMFLEDGTPLESVDALQQTWTGQAPAQPAPRVEDLSLNEQDAGDNVQVEPGVELSATLPVLQASPDARIDWELRVDDHQKGSGGDPEDPPAQVDTHLQSHDKTVHFLAPQEPGEYRLYAYLHDHGKAATANIPFLVMGPRRAGSFEVERVQTSREGDRLSPLPTLKVVDAGHASEIRLDLDASQTFQTIEGIGGAFTESTAWVLQQLPAEQRQEVIDAYFSDAGAHYSLTRTHVASCDFSLDHYTYAPVPDDTELQSFTIEHDREALIPLIQDAMRASSDGFKILASPWTPPPWMKDNNEWEDGVLLKQYYPTYARYFSKYLTAYADEGIDIWGITPFNEPEGNGGQWESVRMRPDEMAELVAEHLGPQFEQDGHGDVKIFFFDQNRGGAEHWADTYYANEKAKRYATGMAVHWYDSTVQVRREILRRVQERYPDKTIMHTEGCIDAIGDTEKPGAWLKDDWYWQQAATDWGYRWAPEQDRYRHPKYSAFYRYARDLVGGLGAGLTGWIDWNMVLTFEGGPNLADNWCLAPVLADPASGRVYYTPLYYAMAHVSKYVRPGAKRIRCPEIMLGLWAVAFANPDGSIAVVLLNQEPEAKTFAIQIDGELLQGEIAAEAMQTVVLNPAQKGQ